MGGSLEAFKLFTESEKRRQARYDQMNAKSIVTTDGTGAVNSSGPKTAIEVVQDRPAQSSQKVSTGTAVQS